VSKKKILYVHHGKGIGGAPLSLLYLIENLDKSKYHPIVLFLYDSEIINIYKSKNIEVVGPINEMDFPHTKIWWLRWYHFYTLLKSVWSAVKTLWFVADYWLDSIKPDLIHLNTSSLIAWGKVASKKGIPVIWHIREPLADGYFGIRKAIVQKCVEKYATIIVPICKNDAKPWLNNPKVNVVYNAVDLNLFNPAIQTSFDSIISSKSPRILFVGGLSREKGTLIIFKVFKKLLKQIPNAKLIVAGYFDLKLKKTFDPKKFFPAERYKYEIISALESIKNKVIFLGPVKNVPEVMAACDVVVFPSTVGHFARPVIEAACMKKPVVASNLSPLDELVIGNKTGFLVDIKDIYLWSEKLKILLTDKNLNQKMGGNAFDFATSKFDVKNQIKQIEKIYSRIIY